MRVSHIDKMRFYMECNESKGVRRPVHWSYNRCNNTFVEVTTLNDCHGCTSTEVEMFVWSNLYIGIYTALHL
jgi:hypothetical protein